MRFENRQDAGRQLCPFLSCYKGKGVVLYAFPRGGVLVAKPIAEELQVPIELLLTRKIGHPLHPEYAIAAISERGFLITGSEPINPSWLEEKKQEQMQEIARRKKHYLLGRKEVDPKDKIALIIDDGIATGLTLRAGIMELHSRHPKQIIVAVPVAPQEVAMELEKLVDRFIAVQIPSVFLGSVGAYYQDFSEVSDAEVIATIQTTRLY